MKLITTYMQPIKTNVKHIKTNLKHKTQYIKHIKTYIKHINTYMKPITNYSFAIICYVLLSFSWRIEGQKPSQKLEGLWSLTVSKDRLKCTTAFRVMTKSRNHIRIHMFYIGLYRFYIGCYRFYMIFIGFI